jgi:hypothetical protein
MATKSGGSNSALVPILVVGAVVVIGGGAWALMSRGGDEPETPAVQRDRPAAPARAQDGEDKTGEKAKPEARSRDRSRERRDTREREERKRTPTDVGRDRDRPDTKKKDKKKDKKKKEKKKPATPPGTFREPPAVAEERKAVTGGRWSRRRRSSRFPRRYSSGLRSRAE